MASDDAVEPTSPTTVAVARPGASTAITVDTTTADSDRIEVSSGLFRGSRAPEGVAEETADAGGHADDAEQQQLLEAASRCGYSLLTTNAMNSARKPVSTRIVPLAQSVAGRPMGGKTGGRGRGQHLAGLLDRHLALGRLHPGRDPQAQHAADDAARGGEDQRAGDAGHAGQQRRERAGDPAGDQPEHRQPGVRLDQGALSGSTRGVSAALSTPNDLDSTSIPSAHG